MIVILLAAGHDQRLQQDIRNDDSGEFSHLYGVPKALLPVKGTSGKTILDLWWEHVSLRKEFDRVYLVTNADKYKHFERWATAHDFPVEDIINDGTTRNSNRLGSVADVELALRTKNVTGDIMVVAADMLFSSDFDISCVTSYFKRIDGELVMYYEILQQEEKQKRGMIDIDLTDHVITKVVEKPEGQCDLKYGSVVFYCFRRSSTKLLSEFMDLHPDVNDRSFGRLLEWIIAKQKSTLYGMKLLHGCFTLIGQATSLQDIIQSCNRLEEAHKTSSPTMGVSTRYGAITHRANARIGLMGNPSDGYHGKTISMTIDNFWAEANIRSSEKLTLQPHPLNDPNSFGSLNDLYRISQKEGYMGGLRLMQATCKKFWEYCADHGIALARRNFTLSYDTNIPRQVGLAGSSCIVVAVIKCLMQFYGLSDEDIPLPIRPNLVLSVETQELHIAAGLQDRVVQVYEGLVYMDFDKEYMNEHKHGKYSRMDISLAPPLWLAFAVDPSDSGRIHNDVRDRWMNGDTEVVEAMRTWADLADHCKVALEKRDYNAVANLMNQNFALRRKIFGDATLGKVNLRMAEIAQNHNSAVKFPGSGGAVVGLSPSEQDKQSLKRELEKEGFVFVSLVPHVPACK